MANVPAPGRFAIHKCVISQKRPAALATRAAKDRRRAEQLFRVLLEDRPADIMATHSLQTLKMDWSCCRTIAPARHDALDLYSLSMIFVFEVRVKEGWTAEAYADAWVRASEIIQRAPGSRGTRLHRSIGDPGYLLAIASWDSKTARDAMEAHPSEEVRRIIATQAEFVDINVIGEFEDPDWVVEPDR